MTPAIRDNRIRLGFHEIFGQAAKVHVFERAEDTIRVDVMPSDHTAYTFWIQICSDDDGFLYAYPDNDEPCVACIRIRLP